MSNGISSNIGHADEKYIYVRGMNLTEEIVGKLSFTEMIYLVIMGRMPEDPEKQLLDAVLVSLVDHGITPSAASARLTYSLAPEALQGAVAAGLMGAGSKVLGSMEQCGQLLDEIASLVDEGQAADDAVRQRLEAWLQSGRHIPGVGHGMHKGGDPRAARLLNIATELGFDKKYVPLVTKVVEQTQEITGKALPLNVTGAVAAVLMELGIEWQVLRGFALISRTAGLIAHIREERTAPISGALRKALQGKS